MATILLAAAGASLGSGIGGTVLGLSGAVIGRAAGATLGRVLDQRLLGLGAQPVETGRIDRFRVTGARDGADLPLVWGRMRVAGQIIWASRFEETRVEQRSGKLSPRPGTVEYSYSVSLAVALGEGPILGIGRIWADGAEIAREDLQLRVHLGTEDQLADPTIEAVEGAGQVPAYRGTAYVVIEDLALAPFGNRVPQFGFEVLRSAAPQPDAPADLPGVVQGVALIPGTGEYALATTPVTLRKGPDEVVSANINTVQAVSDLDVSLTALTTELPRVESVGLIVSWFGDDLRCGACSLRPKVEQESPDGTEMPWRVSGLTRGDALRVPVQDDRVVYGGTPADASVVEAVRAIRAQGRAVMFYPFLLMEQLAGNGLPDPYTDAADQPVLPWRGRITLSVAPGRPGTPDRSAAAEAEVAAFFGAAQPSDFVVTGEQVDYSGPEDWGLRRMILHYAHLCAAAGGVEAFCIGSEFRGLTTIRGAGDSFPAVAALRALAADVRAILGPETVITYAADWTEYAGYDDGAGNRYFHLDPLWSDPVIGAVGIDNYMPLSDWREGEDHADAGWGSVHDLAYLSANIEGGEYFDWFYPDDRAREAQRRVPIEDGAHAEPWVFRLKDLRGWWANTHHERIGGIRQVQPTAWMPGSKPFWFTEYGCAAIDKGTNQPNVFLDPKSSESFAPRFSNGRRDDLIQQQYLRAMTAYWSDPANNPVSDVYGGPMVAMDRAHVWAWDARPFPAFPGNLDLWADGGNWLRGHWISGRALAQPLAAVVHEICIRAGLRAEEVDVSDLQGLVRGYAVGSGDSGRAALQPLMTVHGFDAVERDGKLAFAMRGAPAAAELERGGLVEAAQGEATVEIVRAAQAEIAGRVRLGYLRADGVFEPETAEAVMPDEGAPAVAQSEVPMLLTPGEARGLAGRWLAEARVARDVARFGLPRSSGLRAGDVVALDGGLWRIDRLELSEARAVEAVRVERGLYRGGDLDESLPAVQGFVPPVPVSPVFLDLPLMRSDEVPHAPHLAVAARPWPGLVSVHAAGLEDGAFVLNRLFAAPSVLGVTETELAPASPGLWDRGAPLRVRARRAGFASATDAGVLNGANLVAIGDGTPDGWELFQFAHAELVGPNLWELSRRLRGQFGTERAMRDPWPVGSRVVPIRAEVLQVDLPAGLRGIAQRWRIGPAARPIDDPSQTEIVAAFSGVGLRPLAPVHLRATPGPAGGVTLRWVRRGRIDADSWDGADVPLGEDREAYLVRVRQGDAVVRSAEVGGPAWSYPATARAADGVSGTYTIEVAQISAQFGPGVFAEIRLEA